VVLVVGGGHGVCVVSVGVVDGGRGVGVVGGGRLVPAGVDKIRRRGVISLAMGSQLGARLYWGGAHIGTAYLHDMPKFLVVWAPQGTCRVCPNLVVRAFFARHSERRRERGSARRVAVWVFYAKAFGLFWVRWLKKRALMGLKSPGLSAGVDRRHPPQNCGGTGGIATCRQQVSHSPVDGNQTMLLRSQLSLQYV